MRQEPAPSPLTSRRQLRGSTVLSASHARPGIYTSLKCFTLCVLGHVPLGAAAAGGALACGAFGAATAGGAFARGAFACGAFACGAYGAAAARIATTRRQQLIYSLISVNPSLEGVGHAAVANWFQRAVLRLHAAEVGWRTCPSPLTRRAPPCDLGGTLRDPLHEADHFAALCPPHQEHQPRKLNANEIVSGVDGF